MGVPTVIVMRDELVDAVRSDSDLRDRLTDLVLQGRKDGVALVFDPHFDATAWQSDTATLLTSRDEVLAHLRERLAITRTEGTDV